MRYLKDILWCERTFTVLEGIKFCKGVSASVHWDEELNESFGFGMRQSMNFIDV